MCPQGADERRGIAEDQMDMREFCQLALLVFLLPLKRKESTNAASVI